MGDQKTPLNHFELGTR